MRTAKFVVRPDLVTQDLDPFRDLIGITMDLQVDGVTESFSLGIFALNFPDRKFSPTGEDWTVGAVDLSVRLLEAGNGTPYNVPASTNVITAVETVLDILGLQHGLQATGLSTPFALTWGPEVVFANIVQDLLSSINYHPIFADVDGIFRAIERTDLATQGHAFSYEDGDGLVVPNFVLKEKPRKNPNQVTAVREADIAAPIFSRATNQTAESISSVSNLGGSIKPGSPFQIDGCPDQATLDAIALTELRNFSMRSSSAQLLTVFDPRRQEHEVYQLTIGADRIAETWAVEGWTAQLQPGALMSHGISKAVVLTNVDTSNTDDVV